MYEIYWRTPSCQLGTSPLLPLLANNFPVCRTNYSQIFCISVRIKAFAIKTNNKHRLSHFIAICIMVDYAYAMCACAAKLKVELGKSFLGLGLTMLSDYLNDLAPGPLWATINYETGKTPGRGCFA